MTTNAVSAVHYNPAIERWEFVVGSEVWGDYATQHEAYWAMDDYEAEQKARRERCLECGGSGTDLRFDIKACAACGGSGRDCSGVEVRS